VPAQERVVLLDLQPSARVVAILGRYVAGGRLTFGAGLRTLERDLYPIALLLCHGALPN